jgi:hypothetical protein
MNTLIEPIDSSVKDAQTFQNGSDQERTALDKAYKNQDDFQKLLTKLEEQMVPAGYETPVPDDYNDLPQLRGGRATVEFLLKRPGNAPFDVEGVNFPEAKMTMVIGECVIVYKDICIYIYIYILVFSINTVCIICFWLMMSKSFMKESKVALVSCDIN